MISHDNIFSSQWCYEHNSDLLKGSVWYQSACISPCESSTMDCFHTRTGAVNCPLYVSAGFDLQFSAEFKAAQNIYYFPECSAVIL